MSWQEYVDVELIGSGYCKTASIIGMDGTEHAVSLNGHIEKNEITNLISLFGDAKKRQAGNKLKLKGNECVIKFGGDRTISCQIEDSKDGFICVKTKQTIIVTGYGDYISHDDCWNVIQKFSDYLILKGF